MDAEEAVRVLLRSIDEDPDRDGLVDTPRRVVAALREMTKNGDDAERLLAVTFDAGAYDEMIAVVGVEFTSLCEHHLMPFSGTATVGYVPSNRVVGLSKLARLVEVYARRLQIQERMTRQIADALVTHLDPAGVGVLVRAEHSCMACRGIRSRAPLVTSAMLGAMRDDSAARAEFLALGRV